MCSDRQDQKVRCVIDTGDVGWKVTPWEMSRVELSADQVISHAPSHDGFSCLSHRS